MTPRHFRAGLLTSTLLFSAHTYAAAQTAPTPDTQRAGDTPKATHPPEEPAAGDIVVTGIRAAIDDAARTKRSAGVILDSISALDIGKLPDQNVSETLSRIPGVQISRREGEGAKVNVRGIDLNKTTLNGHNFIGASNNGDPNFQDFPSEILAAVDIVKSPSTEYLEGWLGAIINLRTRRPLDLKKPLLAGRVQGVYADKADKLGGKASATAGTTFANGTLGVLVSGTYNTFKGRTDLFTDRGFTALTGVPLTGPGAIAGTVFRPNRFESLISQYNQKRYGVTGTIQWQPSEAFLLTVDGFKQNSNTDRVRYETQLIFLGTFSGANVLADGTVDSATVTGVTVRPIIFSSPSTTDADALSFDARYRTGRFTVKLSGSLSSGDNNGGNDQGLENFLGIAGNDRTIVNRQIAGNTASVTYSGLGRGVLPNFAYTTNYNFSDPSQYEGFTVVDFEYLNHNRGKDAALDLQYEPDAGLVKAIKGGVRIERVTSQQVQETRNYSAAQLVAGDPTPGTTLRANEIGGLSFAGTQNNLFDDVSGNFPHTLLGGTFDIDAFRTRFNAVIDQPATLSTLLDARQTTKAAYGQIDFAGELGDVTYSGNVGVRYVNTQRTSFGYDRVGTTVTPRTVEIGFSDWLPSFNFSLVPTRKVTLRVAAAKVLARPPLSLTGVGITFNPTASTGAAGNPLLRPFKATQYDISAEWYFAPASQITVAGFYKDVSAFTTSTITVENHPEIVAPGLTNTLYNVSRPTNGSNGSIKGFEINYFQAFSFLPAPFDGFGMNVSFTRAIGETPAKDALTGDALSLVNLSKTSYNLVGYYEKYGVNARVAYNYRSSYLLAIQPASLGGSLFAQGRGQLDASLSYQLTPRMQISVDALNLTKSIRTLYTGTENRFTTAIQDDRRIYFGIGVNF